MAGVSAEYDPRYANAMALEEDVEASASMYRKVLVVYIAVVFYSGITGILYRVGIIPLQTQALLALFALPLAFSAFGVQAIRRSRLLMWIVGYLMLSAFWYLMSSQPPVATDAFKNRILAMIYLVSITLVLADWRTHRMIRKLIVIGVLLEASLLLLEFMTSVQIGNATERGTALHDNPNAAGAALLAGWIVSAGVLSPRLRHWYALIVGVGAFLTFSRGAIVMWTALTCVMLWQRSLSGRVLLSAGAKVVLGLALAVTVSGKWGVITDAALASIGESDAIRRLAVLGRWDLSTNPGTADRVNVAARAWGMFADNPLFGQGIGSTIWANSPSTHNMVLRHLAEHGVIGFVLYPAFVAAVVWRAHPALRPTTALFLTFLVLWSLVSHNVLDDRPALVCVALLAAMVTESRSAAEEGMEYRVPGDYEPPEPELQTHGVSRDRLPQSIQEEMGVSA